MRNKENKHRKGQESTIGKIIYGFLLFMPLIAIGVTCGYAMFNKNAYQSYSDSNLIESKAEITNYEELQDDVIYNFDFDDSQQSGYTGRFGFKDISVDLYNIFPNMVVRDYVAFLFYGNDQNIIWYYLENDTLTSYYYGTAKGNLEKFSITLDIQYTQSTLTIHKWNIYTYVFKQSKIDNVFYYAVDKVTESPLFSWAQNSVIYTTTNTTCNALSITTPFIPLLLSYWLIISVIYFLYDIALMFVWLIHRKIHELQESL